MITVILLSSLLVIVCVGIHYNSLVSLSSLRRRFGEKRKWWINLVILGALLTHVVEMMLFSLCYSLLGPWDRYGSIIDSSGNPSEDYWYFSFVAYTSLGFGDLTPVGALRFMTALETLTGLVLIAWTASFLFVEMQSWAEEAQQE
ncbi:potassium channel family protein [Thalassoglobus polymorphus]|uniref:Ion channel n=1 Tax=Thalassoglobus polymorphus TaxID=2527994 RepID=A0A517QK86_9PLAN|nr:potassium channel family protein [Thalassoglobus polymorphus]QDT32035.1 Ion channel [Thalassoglobus polymorphus]